MYIVAITGASGSILGIRLIEELLKLKIKCGTIVSEHAANVISHELLDGRKFVGIINLLNERDIETENLLTEYQSDDMFAGPASGSFKTDGMIITPCSMKTLAAIANGYADNLITRSADVTLKEKRPLVLLPRETPLNLIHLENLRQVKLAGADIVLPVPGYYTHPQSIDDVNNFITGKTLDILGIEHHLFKRWK